MRYRAKRRTTAREAVLADRPCACAHNHPVPVQLPKTAGQERGVIQLMNLPAPPLPQSSVTEQLLR